MNILKSVFPLFLLLLVFSGCRKDELVIDETPNPPTPTIKVEVVVSGEVYNLLGDPISGATIRLGKTTAMTDDNGYYQITGLANESKAVLAIEKNNYFTGHPVFYPEQGVGQHVKFALQDRVVAGTINPLTNDLKIVNYEQHQIDFGNSTYANADGSSYTGNVNVFISYLNPTDENLFDYMPGDLVGVNTENVEQYLSSYGMLNVELESEAGSPLTMNGEASLTMEVPNNLLSNAPATIPLWYFDTATGNWIEEGQATLEGNQYVGTVSHFTLWNCDVPFDLVTINGSINSNLSPSSFTVKVIRPNGLSATTSLDENLGFEGKVPANETLTLQIFDNCGSVIYDAEIGPYSIDIDLGALEVNASILQPVSISGTAINCELQPVNNGYAIITDGSGNFDFANFDSNGNFTAELAWCLANPINIICFDSDLNKESKTTTFDYMETIEANEIIVCEETIAGIYISGPVVNLFIPAVGNIVQSNTEPILIPLKMQCIHDQGNENKVLYDITLLNWMDDPINPQLSISYVTTNIGNPDPIFTWTNDFMQSPIYTIYGDESGDLIDLKYGDVTILETSGSTGGLIHEGHEIRIVGTVQ